MNFYLKYGKEKIKLADKPFAGGGEGNLYKILSPKSYQGYVAKIYHPFKRTEERTKKIHYLYQHPPEGLAQGQHPAYIWVHDVLEDKNKDFMGFIMPYVRGEKLEVLCTPKLPKKLNSAWKRFDPREKKAFDLRLKLCFNLAAAVYHVHSTGRYVIVDLKPENVIVQPDGLVSLVDMDSVEVVEEDRVIFQAPVATPEYTPVEHYTKASRLHEEDAINASWDLFALATIFYKLLFGIHPFAASAKPPYDQLVSLHQKIEHGLFVHHPQKDQIFKVIPPPHQRFSNLTEELQNLFLQTFVDGHEDPESRPLAEEWCIALLNTFGNEKMKAHFQNLLLIRGGTSRVLRKPSTLVRLPAVELKEEDLVPADYHAVLAWNAPEPKAAIPTNNIKINSHFDNKWNHIFSTGSSILIFSLFFIFSPAFNSWVNHNLWEVSNMNAMITVLLLLVGPILILPLLVHIFQRRFDPQLKAWKRAKKDFKNYLGEFQQSKKVFSELKSQLSTKIKEHLPNFKQFLTEAQKIQNQLKAWLQEQDEQLVLLVKEEKIAAAEIRKPFILAIEKALPFDLKKEEEALDFHQIKKQLDQNRQQAIQAIENQKMDKRLVSSNAEVRKFIDEEIKKIEWEQQQYLKEWEERHILLNLQQEHDEKALDQKLKEEANIKSKYHQYLIQVRQKKKIATKLIHAGLKSVLEIERIDHLRAQLELKNGQVILLDNITDSAIELASKLGDWFIKIRKLKQEYKDEQLRIERFYNQERKALKTVKAERLNFYKEELDNIRNKAELAYKRLKMKEIVNEFAQYYSLVEKERKDYLEALKGSSEQYKLQYEQLVEKVHKEQAAKAAQIRALEDALKENSLKQLEAANLGKICLSGLEQMDLIQEKAKDVQKAEAQFLKFKT
jgi:serine/threonine protein kinase